MHRTLITLVKKNGVLVPASINEQRKLTELTASVGEGKLVETYLEEQGEENHTLVQLAKFHAIARDIATEIGESPDEVKSYIKNRVGLTRIDSTGEEVVKSFRDCTKHELNQAIAEASHLCTVLNIPEHGSATPTV